MNVLDTYSAASRPSAIAVAVSATRKSTMTESVSPYTTTASAGYPLAAV